jgi:hypothetical protein
MTLGVKAEFILESGTTATLDADTEHRPGRLVAKNIRNTLRGSFADGNGHGKCGSWNSSSGK